MTRCNVLEESRIKAAAQIRPRCSASDLKRLRIGRIFSGMVKIFTGNISNSQAIFKLLCSSPADRDFRSVFIRSG